MEKPVFSSDILSFCKEMGVESPEQLIGKRIYFKYISPYNKPDFTITFSSILRVSFGVGKREEGQRVSLHFAENNLPNEAHVLHYFLKEKKWKILQAEKKEAEDVEWWYTDFCNIEEIYIYPE